LPKPLNKYQPFTSDDVNYKFILGTFGYEEEYSTLSPSSSFIIYTLQDDANVYNGNPYLFVSTGSGGSPGYMYLDLDYSNLWSSLCCECVLKIVKKLAGEVI